MVVRTLTVAMVEKVKPASARVAIGDKKATGLELVIHPSGKKTWTVRYRLRGKPDKITLGSVDLYGLPEARNEARAIRVEASRGADPKVTRGKRHGSGALVPTVVDEWLKLDAGPARRRRPKRESTLREVRALFDTELAEWKTLPLPEVTREKCLKLIDRVRDRSESRALKLHAYLRRMLTWAVGRGIIQANPMTGMERPPAPPSRDRVLPDAELRLVWLASKDLGSPFRAVVRLLILTGLRRDEVLSLRWDEVSLIDLGSGPKIMLPGERTKNGQPHRVPLAPEAARILRGMPRVSIGHGKTSPFVFTTTGTTAASGVSRAKSRLDHLIAALAEKEAKENGREVREMAPWRLHDLRRTAATRMADLGVPPHVVEAVLNHISGFRAGVAGTYNRAEYAPEKRAALQMWAEHVATLGA